jgi:hypothetical protein
MSIQEIIDLKTALFVTEKCSKKVSIVDPLVRVVEQDQEIHLSDLDVADEYDTSEDEEFEDV